MSSLFPGMDPYLEECAIWRGFHHRLADEIADRLNPTIGPKYYVALEIHTAFEEVNIGTSKPKSQLTRCRCRWSHHARINWWGRSCRSPADRRQSSLRSHRQPPAIGWDTCTGFWQRIQP